jgi:hypothetical protein
LQEGSLIPEEPSTEKEPAQPLSETVINEASAPPPIAEVKSKSSSSRTVKLTDLLKTQQKKEESVQSNSQEKPADESFTPEQLQSAWNEFASQRKKFQAEFQMLSQPYEVRGKLIVVNLLSPVHETMLNNLKVELTAFLRDKLKNSSLQVTGELTKTDDKKVIYTNKEKFDYLADKNPILKELKDRLGLDTDF